MFLVIIFLKKNDKMITRNIKAIGKEPNPIDTYTWSGKNLFFISIGMNFEFRTKELIKLFIVDSVLETSTHKFSAVVAFPKYIKANNNQSKILIMNTQNKKILFNF